MFLNYISVCEMLDVLRQTGSSSVSHEAQGILSRIQGMAEVVDSMGKEDLIIENRITEIFVQELINAVVKYGEASDKRVVQSFMSNELMAACDAN